MLSVSDVIETNSWLSSETVRKFSKMQETQVIA